MQDKYTKKCAADKEAADNSAIYKEAADNIATANATTQNSFVGRETILKNSGSKKLAKNTLRLDKLLSNFGYGSRSEIRRLIKKEVIVVDGIIVSDASMHVDPEKSRIEIYGEQLNYRKFIYIMMNKPAGVISATYDTKMRTAIDLLPEEFSCFDLFPAGRLDIDTEGMLLLINDGQLAHNLLSPKKHVQKRYYALIDAIVSEEDIKLFRTGVILDDGYKTMPAELEIVQSSNKGDAGETISRGLYSEVELVIHEGKFHQVKRMFEAVGKKVVYLKRTQMGGLMLDTSLKPGECRELFPEEVEMLKQRN